MGEIKSKEIGREERREEKEFKGAASCWDSSVYVPGTCPCDKCNELVCSVKCGRMC